VKKEIAQVTEKHKIGQVCNEPTCIQEIAASLTLWFKSFNNCRTCEVETRLGISVANYARK
jgi:hypothetical protein